MRIHTFVSVHSGFVSWGNVDVLDTGTYVDVVGTWDGTGVGLAATSVVDVDVGLAATSVVDVDVAVLCFVVVVVVVLQTLAFAKTSDTNANRLPPSTSRACY